MRHAGTFVLVTPSPPGAAPRIAREPGMPCVEPALTGPAGDDQDGDRRFLQALLRVRAATRASRADRATRRDRPVEDLDEG